MLFDVCFLFFFFVAADIPDLALLRVVGLVVGGGWDESPSVAPRGETILLLLFSSSH